MCNDLLAYFCKYMFGHSSNFLRNIEQFKFTPSIFIFFFLSLSYLNMQKSVCRNLRHQYKHVGIAHTWQYIYFVNRINWKFKDI